VPPAGTRTGIRRPPAQPTVVGLDVSEAVAQATLIMKRTVRLTGPAGQFTLEAGRHVVGRNEGIGVPILDLQVSRSHAIIAVTDQGVTVEDTKSANGTTVNGTRIDKPTTLNHGDKVAFGKIEFTVELIS
jgi:pSer/pThr/pTyr-binding forkhead associated (FHA) protein